MDRNNSIVKEKIKITVKEILLNLVDFSVEYVECFKRRREDFEITDIYKDWRLINKNNYHQSVWRLEKQGYISRYKKRKKTNFALTEKGRKKAYKYILGDLIIKPPKIWDKKWRVVIFDITEDKKSIRESVRMKLKQFGFFQLQKSVWVYPFDCREIIYTLKYVYSLGKNVQFLLVDTIESEYDLIDYFYEQKILSKKIKIK